MIVAIASQKGGVGKTSTSISLSAGLARKGKKALLIDIDSQANSSKVIIKDYQAIPKEQTIFATILSRSPLPIHKTEIDNLDIVPSHILLSNTDVELTTAIDHREERLKRELDAVKHNYDYIFIDCPPTLSWLTINAFTAADKVMVIVSPGYFELDSIVQISKTIHEVKEFFNPQLQLAGFLFTMSDPTVNSKTSLQILRQTYTGNVFNTVIPRNTDIRDAHFERKDIFSYNSHAASAQAYDKLIQEIFKV
jgi:chromosome partitioning protein